ncbi:hypothetical protein [Photorhabdus asymbiotica]|uniref:hypothetical protein n=1 Tax=Photorhabdus asymbiotica TaxID=291112 RepID=UPI003DA6E362
MELNSCSKIRVSAREVIAFHDRILQHFPEAATGEKTVSQLAQYLRELVDSSDSPCLS